MTRELSLVPTFFKGKTVVFNGYDKVSGIYLVVFIIVLHKLNMNFYTTKVIGRRNIFEMLEIVDNITR